MNFFQVEGNGTDKLLVRRISVLLSFYNTDDVVEQGWGIQFLDRNFADEILKDRQQQYKNYFEDFLLKQPKKVQDKIFKVIEIIETYERVPSTYLKAIVGTKGLYEARIKLGSNIWRVFCFSDKGKLVILLNGFTKKTQKTPQKEIDKAIGLMNSYYEDKER